MVKYLMIEVRKTPISIFLIVSILIVISDAAYPQSELPQLARLHYDGGGDWYNDPDTLPNLVEFLNRTIKTNFSSVQAVVRPSEANLFDYPFIFMTGHGNVSFSEREAKNLREYLLKGGFLYADDDYGMDPSFRREIRRVFPDREFVELPANHEIFHSFYSFSEGLPKIHEHDGKRPQAFAVFDDTGRLMVLYTYESNISDAWTAAHDNPPEVREEAFRMGANMMYYIMTQ